MKAWFPVLAIVFLAAASLFATQGIREKQALKLYPIRLGDSYGYIDSKGVVQIQPEFDYAWNFRDGMAKVEIDGKSGFIGPDGKFLIPPRRLETDEYFSEGMTVFYKNHGWGFINAIGDVVIPAQYSYAHNFSEGLAAVNSDWQSCGFIDKTGRFVIEPRFQDNGCGDFSEGLATVRLNGKTGFIDHSGKFVIPPIYAVAGDFDEGLAPVCMGKKSCGYVDALGNVVVNLIYEGSGGFSEGRGQVRVNRKWGYVDRQGVMIIAPQFEDSEAFAEGLAPVEMDRKWGYIDKFGATVIPAQFDSAWYFAGGLAEISVDDSEGVSRFGYIDRSGKILFQLMPLLSDSRKQTLHTTD